MLKKNSNLESSILNLTHKDLKPHLIDIFVGKRIQEHRHKLEWSLSMLAKKLNTLPQQMQSYEQGTARMSAKILFDLSEILGVSINYFYENLSNVPKQNSDQSPQKPSRKTCFIKRSSSMKH